MPHVAGRHFLQIPGPINVPDRVLEVVSRAETVFAGWSAIRTTPNAAEFLTTLLRNRQWGRA